MIENFIYIKIHTLKLLAGADAQIQAQKCCLQIDVADSEASTWLLGKVD